MSDVRYQVQIVSMQTDLDKERRIVEEALSAQDAFYGGFSFPDHTDHYLWKLNQKTLSDTDFVVILLGNQYGPMSATGVGYVHRTYASAYAMGRPTLSLVYRGDAKPTADETDFKRLEEFRAHLKKGLYIEWRNKDELRDAVERGFEKLVENNSAKGWVRPEDRIQNVDQQVMALRKQVALLRKELEKVRLGSGPTEDKEQQSLSLAYECKVFFGGTMKNINGLANWSLEKLFMTVAPSMMEEIPENKIKAVLFDQILETERPKLMRQVPQAHAIVDLKLASQSLDTIRVKLRANGLMTFRQGKWKLTPLGEHRLLYLSEAEHQ
jgi:hypothetical protein